ncbi:hypothetical protein GUJ93_ZPchr0010g8490 [Zizania palustris]|uniref:Uncharacterized protein n=1 Tax=Zizania palustris TaxID=103762 RepID=A0A8J5WGS9_ZIZPA|nr:hypothetical protein GUJ93_ZPchr0010g8490 [Zizania palustris]
MSGRRQKTGFEGRGPHRNCPPRDDRDGATTLRDGGERRRAVATCGGRWTDTQIQRPTPRSGALTPRSGGRWPDPAPPAMTGMGREETLAEETLLRTASDERRRAEQS